ncbi:MAG: CoA pyrophosphatase [Bacteroidetes bacterium]|nr:CoA pyrophosphatase [Bacteroidota bacterium]
MNFDSLIIEQLKAELQKPLPGETAQYRMAPSYRPRLSAADIAAQNPRLGGVMVLLYESNGLLKTVFTKRREYEGVHSGQMSFPGGKKDDTDSDLTATALRETQEEIGIDGNNIELLGKLSELYIPPSNFLVHPAVGFTPAIESFTPQDKEVAEIVEIPLGFFLNEQNIHPQTEIKLFNGHTVRAPAYIYESHVIWGATAIVLSEFSFILQQAIKQR